MATFTAVTPTNADSLTAMFALEFGTEGVVTTGSNGSVTYDWPGASIGHVTLTLKGSGFTSSVPTNAWNITEIDATVNGSPAWKITGLPTSGPTEVFGADLVNSVTFSSPAFWVFRGADSITGSAGNDILFGFDGNDTIRGGAGNDKLDGNKGHDLLTGGAGHDVFEFNERLNTNLAKDNYATITDFNPVQDHIELSYAIFSKVAGFGVLPGAEFHVGTHATTPAQRIIYNPGTGGLYYDPDGSHSQRPELFAILANHAALAHLHLLPTAADFLVI